MNKPTQKVPEHLAPLARYFEVTDIQKNAHLVLENMLTEWTDPDKRSEILAATQTYVEMHETAHQCKFALAFNILTGRPVDNQVHPIDVLLVELKHAGTMVKKAEIFYWITPFQKLDFLPE